MKTLSQLAEYLKCDYKGDPDLEITGAASLENASVTDIVFIISKKYLPLLSRCNAGVVIAPAELSADIKGNVITSLNPHADFASVLNLLYPQKRSNVIHKTAVIDEGVVLGNGVSVGPGACIGKNASLSDEVMVGANAVIGNNVDIGVGTQVEAGSVILDGTQIGRYCIIHAGAVIGADGFGYARSGNSWLKVPQIGIVVLGDDVEIGANTTVDRGALDNTIIGSRVKIDNQVQIAHNVTIGDDTIIAGCVGIAGSAKIGSRCAIGGQAGILGHLEICDDVTVGACSTVSKSIREPGTYSSIMRVEQIEKWQKNLARFHRLDQYIDRIRAIEQSLNIPEGDSQS